MRLTIRYGVPPMVALPLRTSIAIGMVYVVHRFVEQSLASLRSNSGRRLPRFVGRASGHSGGQESARLGGKDIESLLFLFTSGARDAMAQITSGVRSILSTPAVYDFVQNLLGAKRGRRDFVAEFVKPTVGQRVLDIGCGTAEILPFLPCVDYEGFDISAEYINAARARHGERGKFHCRLFTDEDARSVAPADIVLAVGLLHHLDDIEASTFIELAKLALKPGGRLVTLDPCYDSAQTAAARYLVSKDRGQNVRDAARYEQLTTAHFEVVQCAVRHRRWIPYTHCAMVATNLPASTSVAA